MIRWMRSWSGRGRGTALALLTCAMLIRLAIPQGWMPDASAHGFAIKPCPGVVEPSAPEPVHKMHGAHHETARHDPAKHDPAKQMPCDFAGAVHAAAPAEPFPAPLAVIAPAVRTPAPRCSSPRSRRWPRLPTTAAAPRSAAPGPSSR